LSLLPSSRAERDYTKKKKTLASSFSSALHATALSLGFSPRSTCYLGQRIITAPPSSRPAHHCRATIILAGASSRHRQFFNSAGASLPCRHQLGRCIPSPRRQFDLPSSSSRRYDIIYLIAPSRAFHLRCTVANQLLNCAVNRPSFILTPSRASLTCCDVERSSFIRSA
jgi:hypothetical protein